MSERGNCWIVIKNVLSFLEINKETMVFQTGDGSLNAALGTVQ